MKYILILLSIISSISWGQPNELSLPDTIELEVLEITLFEDEIMFHESFDTSYSDDRVTIFQYKDSWAAKSLLHVNTGVSIQHSLILDPDVNTSVDSITYFDLNQDGKDEAIIYYSRTDGTSGQSGGFSDQGKSLMAVDINTYEVYFDVEYSASYENWSHDYDEEKDEYINQESECLSFSAEIHVCEGILLLIENYRNCENVNKDQRVFYYEWDGEQMVRKPYEKKRKFPCD